MRKSSFLISSAIVVMLIIGALYCNRPHISQIENRKKSAIFYSEEPRADANTPAMLQDISRGNSPRIFSREDVIARMAAIAKENPAPLRQPIARDGYYDKLLARQGRDPIREKQLQSKLADVFDDKSETLVGAVACSSEFCRVELQGAGTIDVRDRWKDELFSAVDPRGFRFFVVDQDEGGNTVADLYFGRKDSWTVPDFHALGLL
jgi:hypothetical protein